MLPETFGCRANSKGIVPPWVAGCVARVLSRSEKNNVDHNAHVQSKMRKCREVLTQHGGALDPGDERGETATLGHRKKYVSTSFIQRKSETFGCSEHKGVLSRRVSERRRKLGCAAQPETVQRVHETAETTRCADYLSFMAEAEMKAVDRDHCLDMDDSDADDFEVIPDRDAAVSIGPSVRLEDNPMSLSAEKTRAVPDPMSRILPQPDVATGMVPVPMPEDEVEVNLHAGVVPASARRGLKRWVERADQNDMEVCLDTTDECCNRDAVGILSWYATVGGIKTEPKRMQDCEMFRRRHKYEKPSMQTVVCTTTSHKAKRDETQLRVVTHEYADAMRVLETRALQSVISRVMSKCHTRQLESCDTLSAFFHAWLERGVRVKPPKDPRLSDGLALAAGGSVPTPESRSKQPVVARKRPNDDRRGVRGESVRTVCGQGVEAEFQSQWP